MSKKHRSTWDWEEKRNNIEGALVMLEEPVPFVLPSFQSFGLSFLSVLFSG
jgi:hypothetical protein